MALYSRSRESPHSTIIDEGNRNPPFNGGDSDGDEAEVDPKLRQIISQTMIAAPTLVVPEVTLPGHHLFDVLNPPEPSALFIGRTKELEFLEGFFSRNLEGELAVRGMSGCGKTQLALKFARVASLGRSVFYVDTSSSTFSWSRLLKWLGSSRTKVPQDEYIEQKHTHLELNTIQSRRRVGLVIFDGFFSLDISDTSCARAFRASLLENFGFVRISVLYLVNRFGPVATFGLHTYQLALSLDAEDATCLLIKSACSQRAEPTQVERTISNNIAKDFGYFAPAVVQAGTALQNAGLALQVIGLSSGEQHQWIQKAVNSAGSPWRSNYEALTKSDKVLFKMLVFLPPHDPELLEKILIRARANLATYHALRPAQMDVKQIRREINRILLDGSTEAKTLKEHFMLPSEGEGSRLGSYTWARMLIDDKPSAEAFVAYVLAASAALIITSEYASQLVPLVDSIVLCCPEACAPHWLSFSTVYEVSKRWVDAMRLQERVLDLPKQKLGDHHAVSVATFLAKTYCTVGRWGDARGLQMALLSHLEKTLGESHLDTRSIAHDLASTLSRLGRWEDAEILCKRVCEGRKQILGEIHPDTMASMQSLASSYSGQQRWEEATELHEKVLEMRKGAFGVVHADTLSSMHSLASQHQEKGESTWEAEQSNLQVLRLRRQTLGDKHLDTSSSMFTLALVYHRQGKLESAMELAASALDIQRSNLGRDHFITIQTMHNLSAWYSERGLLADAASLLAEMLESRRAVYGEDHLKTLACMETLVQTYWNQGLSGRAESLHIELLEARKRVLGEDASTYLATLIELATRYLDQCRWREASALYKTALRIKMQDMELGANDQEIAKIQRQLKLALFALSSDVFVITPSVPMQSVVAHFTEKAGLKDYSAQLQETENAPTEPIARGGFSNIYRVILHDGSELAIKCLRNTNSQYKQVKQTIRELSTWSELRHKCVAELLGLALFRDQLAMVSTWNKKGNVIQYIEKNPNMDRYELCKQVVTAVVYLHKLDVTHGDLKGANILVSDDDTLQLADFGLAVMHDATVQFSKSANDISDGTLRWMAPELVFENDAEDGLSGHTAWSMDDTLTKAKDDQAQEEPESKLCKETDIYALGMTMLEILTGKRPFKELEKDTSVILALGEGKRPQRPKRILDQSRRGAPFWDILQKCWSQLPVDRPTANEVNRLMLLMGAD